MFSSLKKKVESKLFFHFIEGCEKPKSIEIIGIDNAIKKVPFHSDEVKITISDLSINEFKVYQCKTKYNSKEEINSITVYYDKNNYYMCGNGKYSAEIIFSDFSSKAIKNEQCQITYDDKIYYPQEDFKLLTRRRINFINIDISKLILPNDLNNKKVIIDPENKNILISISVIDFNKVIGLYVNEPFTERNFIKNEDNILEILKNFIDKFNLIIKFDKEEDFIAYFEKKNDTLLTQYQQLIFDSFAIEVEVSQYFSIYRENLTEKQIQLYDLFSEFMIIFPDFPKQSRKDKKIVVNQYYMEYYYSKIAIDKFYNSLPNYLNNEEKIILKYAACRCIRTLFHNGYGGQNKDLFDFLDFNKEGTIYNDAINFNRDFVSSLTEKSEIFLFFIQINSGSSVNLLTKKLTSRISLLNEEDIKNHLLSTIPKYGIKVKVHSFFDACTFNDVRKTCICESAIFGYNLNDANILSKYDLIYNKRFIISHLLQHEDFAHIKTSINFYAFNDDSIPKIKTNEIMIFDSEPQSPKEYYQFKGKKEGFIEIITEKEINNEKFILGESGLALSYFLTRGESRLMKLFNATKFDFTILFKNPSLLAAENLDEFINILETIYKENNLCNKEKDDNTSKTKFKFSIYHEGRALGYPTIEKF